MATRLRTVWLGAFLSAALGGSVLAAVLLGSSLPSGAAGSPSAFYLDIGGSASVGYQPTSARPHGQGTDEGYANDLVRAEAARGVTLDLVQSGCPGESTQTMLDGGDHCYAPPTTQLSVDEAFLRAHHDQAGLVTLDLGFNDVAPCLFRHTIRPSCVTSGLALVAQQLPQIIDQLRTAAGPEVRFVGVGHYDPFLGDYLGGRADQPFAMGSLAVIARLDHTLQVAYAARGIPMADVAGAFGTWNTSLIVTPRLGSVPSDVAQVCTLTWMCNAPPFGPNVHPDGAGYQAMERAIADVLPTLG